MVLQMRYQEPPRFSNIGWEKGEGGARVFTLLLGGTNAIFFFALFVFQIAKFDEGLAHIYATLIEQLVLH